MKNVSARFIQSLSKNDYLNKFLKASLQQKNQKMTILQLLMSFANSDRGTSTEDFLEIDAEFLKSEQNSNERLMM